MPEKPLQVEEGENELRISIALPMPGRAAQVVGKVAAGCATKYLASESGSPFVSNHKLSIEHTKNFKIVRWNGETFSFSTMQARIVEALATAISGGHEYLDAETLINCAESAGTEIYPLFKKHPAWGSWIIPATRISQRPATYTLCTEGVQP